MNKYSTLFFFLLAALVFPQHGQAQLVAVPDQDNPIAGPYVDTDVPTIGDLPYVKNQFVVRYDVAPNTEQRAQIFSNLKDQNIIIQEWSPSGLFMLANGRLEGDICEYTIYGNPENLPEPEADQIDLNYITNSEFSYDYAPIALPCLLDPNDDLNRATKYSPTFNCSDDQSLLPKTGSNKVHVAILDSGLRGEGAAGRRNKVAYSQVLVPNDCSFERCVPITGEEQIRAQSASFNRHGAHIFDLISSWFLSQEMESQLSISSYQILDENLRGTMFQMIKAIELATYARNKPHIISMSLGFTPLNCAASDPDREIPTLLSAALKNAEDQNIIVIASAGNKGRNIDVTPQYPAAEDGLHNLVTVGALNCGSNTRAPFSNFGANHVDLFAPGASIKVLDDSYCYIGVNGTSFSCPIVAAKAAFHVTAQSTYNDDDVLCLLRSQAIPMAGSTYGIVSSNVAVTRACSVKPPGDDDFEKRASRSLSTTISPNPFVDQLTISTPSASSKEQSIITLLDGQGREVLRQAANSSSTTLNLQELKRGVYWLNITSASGSETRPVVKR
ncbi:MAG: S8 family serine peptidase [Lewinella sp.]